MDAGVGDCVRSHVSWISAKALAGGGCLGQADGIDWAWVPSEQTVHVLFPVDPSLAAVREIVAIADERGARATALWSASDASRDWLEELGFEHGWQPWWMTAAPADVPAPATGRAALAERVRDHDHDKSALLVRSDTALAEAHLRSRYAGRAWMHLDGEVAGVYDMDVWPPFRRRGLGRDLLATLVSEAARRGARIVTLNATPDGAELYGRSGFRRVGEGRTWWRHARRPPVEG